MAKRRRRETTRCHQEHLDPLTRLGRNLGEFQKESSFEAVKGELLLLLQMDVGF